MRRFIPLAFLLIAAPRCALAQAVDEATAPPPDTGDAQAPPDAPPPQPPAPSAQASVGLEGQWVYTGQYGWLWMPYGREYTYVPGGARAYPDMYVYYPAYGWRWVVAPWVYGYGPAPYWGVRGPRFFVWYAHPWFRVGGHWGWGGYRGWGHYRGWVGPRTWGAHGWRRAPAYYRTGVGGPHRAHVFRAGPAPARGFHRRHR